MIPRLTLGIDEVFRLSLSFTERLIDGAFALAHSTARRDRPVDDRNAQVLPLGGLRCGNLHLPSLVLELASIAQTPSPGECVEVYNDREAPAARAEAQAHWKLKPPRCPVTSTASPMK